jgi:hypothetical protein
VGRRPKRDITRETHKHRRHHDDCVSGCVDLCECCAWECLYHAMRALRKPAGLGMERQNREFLSLPVVLCFIRIFPLFRFCRRGEKWKGEEETYYRDIHWVREGKGRKKNGYDISNVWLSSGREVNSSIKQGRKDESELQRSTFICLRRDTCWENQRYTLGSRMKLAAAEWNQETDRNTTEWRNSWMDDEYL